MEAEDSGFISIASSADSGFISIASSAKLQYLLALKDLLNAVAMLRDGDGSFRADLKSRIKRVADSIEAELGLLEKE